MKNLLKKTYPLIIILVVMAVITAVVSHGRFFAKGNMLTVLYGMVIQIMMLCGIGSILISGNIDLSVGGQATLCTMVFAWICKNSALPWGLVFVITLCFSMCLGLVNTLLVNKLHFPAFIAPIGMSFVGVNPFWVNVFSGVLLLLALALDFIAMSRKSKALAH